jgi:hypothetical protein
LTRAAILLLVSATLPVADAQAQDIRADTVRAAQLDQQILTASSRELETAPRNWRREREQLFTARFNDLVSALAAFSKRYQDGHGSVWPKREAERVAKAMRELQAVEKQFH